MWPFFSVVEQFLTPPPLQKKIETGQEDEAPLEENVAQARIETMVSLLGTTSVSLSLSMTRNLHHYPYRNP